MQISVVMKQQRRCWKLQKCPFFREAREEECLIKKGWKNWLQLLSTLKITDVNETKTCINSCKAFSPHLTQHSYYNGTHTLKTNKQTNKQNLPILILKGKQVWLNFTYLSKKNWKVSQTHKDFGTITPVSFHRITIEYIIIQFS